MTKISDDDIVYLARLSRFTLDDAQKQALKTDLEAILTYISKLEQVDTDGVETTAQVTGLETVTRPDEVRSYSTTPEALIDTAPDNQDRHIKVKKVL